MSWTGSFKPASLYLSTEE